MKITEETTLGTLMQERVKLGVEYLGINDRGPTRTCIIIAALPDGMTTIYGHGDTEATSINDAFDQLRKRRGIAKEPSDAPPTSG